MPLFSLSFTLLSIYRFSNLFKPILPVPRSEGAYVNSGGSAASDNGCPSPTYLKLLFPSSVDTRSPLEVLVMSMKVP